jgi:hypothetical protein
LKRIVALVLLTVAVSLLLPLRPVSAAPYRVLVAGAEVPGAFPHMAGNQLMGAAGPVLDALGASHRFDPAGRTGTIVYGGTTLVFRLGSQLAFQDDRIVWVPVAPYMVGWQPALPLWWLATRLNAGVSFTAATGTLAIAPPFPRGNTPPPPVDHPFLNRAYVFPYPQGAQYLFGHDTWAAPRGFNGRLFAHEGNDIMAEKGTPIVAAAGGTIVRFGWNTLGGYRVTIQLDDYPDYLFYYAHLDRYAPGLALGRRVRTGQLLGYTGSTGSGPERTEGLFPPHLHFGIYGPGLAAINPYYFLRHWERHKVGPL